MKNIICRVTLITGLLFSSFINYAQSDIYEIRVYHLKSAEQVNATDLYLKDAYMPALHRMGLKNIGVFKPISNDTSALKQIYLIVPYNSLDVWKRIKTTLNTEETYINNAKNFTDADTASLPYIRVESILLDAFPYQTRLIPTSLKLNPDAIYELRSYESPTEHLHKAKVDMFNEGREIALFNRLDFQAIFYGDVLSGSRMPNLMYMVVFANLAAREAHWKEFLNSKEWKALTVDPKYENNISVNHIDSYLMRRTPYSDL